MLDINSLINTFNKEIFIDFDGVIVDNNCESYFLNLLNNISFKDNSKEVDNIINEYNRYYKEDYKEIYNYKLIDFLNYIKFNNNNKLIILTNRNIEQKKETIKRLNNNNINIFDDYIFMSGTKSLLSNVDTFIDNNIKYLSISNNPIHYEFKV